jgi:predicted metal-dependent hydrolase
LHAYLNEVFQKAYRQLRPGTSLPSIRVEFYPFVGVKNTIRRQGETLHARVSDQLHDAPEEVMAALAHQLLAKVYRKPPNLAHVTLYRRYITGHEFSAKVHAVQRARGRKQITTPRGDIYHLEEIFDELNQSFFRAQLQRPRMTWSRVRSRRRLGHYDPVHHAIVVSRIFDHHLVPRYAVEYIVYHEMLHLKHPVKLRGSRRCVHSAEFIADEKLFPQLQQAKAFLKTL